MFNTNIVARRNVESQWTLCVCGRGAIGQYYLYGLVSFLTKHFHPFNSIRCLLCLIPKIGLLLYNRALVGVGGIIAGLWILDKIHMKHSCSWANSAGALKIKEMTQKAFYD